MVCVWSVEAMSIESWCDGCFEKKLSVDIEDGFVSDIPGVALHFYVGKDDNELPLWRTARGSSKNEAEHKQLHQVTSSYSNSAENLMRRRVARRTIVNTSIETNVYKGPDVGHFDFLLMDRCVRLVHEVSIHHPELASFPINVPRTGPELKSFGIQRLGDGLLICWPL